MTATFEKVCSTQRRFNNELFVYQSAFPDKPNLVEIHAPRTLVLEKVDAIPYLDVPDFSEEMTAKLALSIARLHSIVRLEDKVLCHWDNQPKNILWSESKHRFYLVDFENIRLNYPETDIAHLFLFWGEVMSSEELYHYVQLFINRYQKEQTLSVSRWQSEAIKARHRFDARRKRYNKLAINKNPDIGKNRKLIANLCLL
jgi:tRNA A-37 threonylcarbamoyl transferase component Bud32